MRGQPPPATGVRLLPLMLAYAVAPTLGGWLTGPGTQDCSGRRTMAAMTWWNTGGQFFLSLYGGAVAVALALSLAAWVVLRTGPTSGAARTSTMELAYLRGGLAHAALTCLAGLRAAGAVEPAPLSTVVATGPAPADAPALMAAVHARLREAAGWSAVLADPEVRRAAGRLDEKLVRRGLLASPTRRRWVRATAVPLFAAAAVGVARLVELTFNLAEAAQGATAGLVLLTVVALFAGWRSLAVPRLTPAGRQVLREATERVDRRERKRDARRRRSAPDLMGLVAVHGPEPLLAADPAFADLVGIRRATEPVPATAGGR